MPAGVSSAAAYLTPCHHAPVRKARRLHPLKNTPIPPEGPPSLRFVGEVAQCWVKLPVPTRPLGFSPTPPACGCSLQSAPPALPPPGTVPGSPPLPTRSHGRETSSCICQVSSHRQLNADTSTRYLAVSKGSRRGRGPPLLAGAPAESSPVAEAEESQSWVTLRNGL